MRILHLSDIHIGIENYGRPVVETDLEKLPTWFAPGEDRKQFLGYSTRLLDFLCAFDEAVAYAIEHKLDLVLFTGDAYKSREPTQTHQREFAKRVARLAQAGIPVFLLVGNHDLPHASYKASAIEIFETLAVPNVTVAEKLGVYTVKTLDGPLQILALPWIRRSAFLAKDEIRNLPYEKINELLQEKLTAGLQAASEDLNPSIPAIVAAHASISSAKIGTERTMMIGYDHIIMKSLFISMPVEYIALGHIHRRQELNQHPPMLYPGSLQRVDFGEEDHESKGFYLITIDKSRTVSNRVTKLEFQPVMARNFVTVEVALTGEELDPTLAVVNAIERHMITEAIVRVHIKMPASLQSSLREREIRHALEKQGAHSIAAITRDVQRTTRTRMNGVALEQQSPIQLLGLYLSTKSTGKERSEKLISLARGLMESEEEDTDGP